MRSEEAAVIEKQSRGSGSPWNQQIKNRFGETDNNEFWELLKIKTCCDQWALLLIHRKRPGELDLIMEVLIH